MERSQSLKTARTKACGIAFIVGLALLLLECAGYLMGVKSSGILFVTGMVIVLLMAAVSAFAGSSNHKTEEVLTFFVAIGFFCWIGWKAFIK
jgi:hypothetical protein